MNEQAECRGCGMTLKGKPYYMGGAAYHPTTREQCKINFYGGYVCSDDCDRAVNNEMKRSIDEHTDPLGYYS